VTRWSTRSGGGIGPYHGNSSCVTRSEGFSRRRLLRGRKWGLKRFRWETQQGVNGSRHAGGAWNVSLEARRKRVGRREGRRSRGEDYECTYTRAHTCRVLLCVNKDIRARAHSTSPKSAATPPLHHHHRYTTTTKVHGVFVHESSVYLVFSVVSVRIQRDAMRRPFALLFLQRCDISSENTQAY